MRLIDQKNEYREFSRIDVFLTIDRKYIVGERLEANYSPPELILKSSGFHSGDLKLDNVIFRGENYDSVSLNFTCIFKSSKKDA